jgi:hypothetical protein
MTEDNTWGADEENIIAGVKAHMTWFNENTDAIVKADQQRIQDLHDVGFTNSAHAQLIDILNDVTEAQRTVERYQELGEDKEGNVSGHLRHAVFCHINNFRVRVGHRLGMKEVFNVRKW